MCHKCHTYIEEGKHIIYMGDPVHPWHYNCYECGYVIFLTELFTYPADIYLFNVSRTKPTEQRMKSVQI